MTPRELPPSSPFAGDDGTADPALTAVLQRHAAGEASVADVVAALASTRVLVPVLAELDVAGAVEHDGQQYTVDKEASAGIVALRTPDGRTALPVFTGVEAMTRWRADARPVPSVVPRAALSAVSEGWEVMVLDPGGPVTVTLPRTAVYALAQGNAWQPAVRDGQVDAEVGAAVRDALADVRLVVEADAVPGTRAEVAVRVALPPGLDRPGLERVLAQVNDALAHHPVIAARVDSLELRVRSA